MISSDFESSEVVQDPTFRPTDTIEHSLMSVTARRCKQPKNERQHNKKTSILWQKQAFIVHYQFIRFVQKTKILKNYSHTGRSEKRLEVA